MITELPAGLVAAALGGGLVPFVGAGISAIAPTSIPAADDLATQIVAAGYGEPGDDLEAASEACWSVGGWQAFARAAHFDEWAARDPNNCHLTLAYLAAEGLIDTVVTTNWDTALEAALARYNIPFTRVARAEDLLATTRGSFRVVKVHGCITLPEQVRARASDVDRTEWIEAWARELFEPVVRQGDLLFLGYSGAARAATRSISRVLAEGERNGQHWTVSRHPIPDGDAAPVRARELYEALGSDPDRYLRAEPEAVLSELVRSLYPRLLLKVELACRDILRALLGPTQLDRAAVEASAREIVQSWCDSGREAFEAEFRRAVPPPYDRRTKVPIQPIGDAIARYCAFLAIATWAGAVSVRGVSAQVRGPQGELAVVPVLAGAVARRDAVGQAAIAILADSESEEAPDRRVAVVILGGVGPMPTSDDGPYSIVRGHPGAGVVRGGGVRPLWLTPDDVFTCIVADSEDGELRARVRELLEGVRE